MNFLKNPFYILDVTSLAKRNEIYDSEESKSLEHDSRELKNAVNILLNPSKRLEAELRWFIGLSVEDNCNIREMLNNIGLTDIGKYCEISNVSALTCLNLELYKLNSIETDNSYTVERLIIQIIRHYNELDVESLMEVINKDREISGIPIINDINEIRKKLHNYQEYISRGIHETIIKLTNEEYIAIIEYLAGRYCKKEGYFNGDFIIDSIVSLYELEFKNKSEDLKKEIYLDTDENKITKENYNEKLSKVISLFNKWSIIMKPVHLINMSKGLSCPDINSMADALSRLGSKIAEDFVDTTEALMFLSEIIDTFKLWPEVYDYMNSIIEDIKEIQISNISDEESILRNRLNKSYDVLASDTDIKIPTYCTCCMKPTSKSEEVTTSVTYKSDKSEKTRKISVNMPICEECLKHREDYKKERWKIALSTMIAGVLGIIVLTYIGMARDKELFWISSYSLAFLGFIVSGSIIKLPKLGNQHAARGKSVKIKVDGYYGREIIFNFTNWKYAKLFSIENGGVIEGREDFILGKIVEVPSKNTAASQKYLGAIKNPVLSGIGSMAIFTLVFLLVMNLNLGFPIDAQNKDTSSAGSQSSTQNGNSSKSNSNTKSTSEQEKINNQLKLIEDELDNLDDVISDMEIEIKSLADDIEYYEIMYYEEEDEYYKYMYEDSIDEYNYMIKRYEDTINNYNDMVNDYNNFLD